MKALADDPWPVLAWVLVGEAHHLWFPGRSIAQYSCSGPAPRVSRRQGDTAPLGSTGVSLGDTLRPSGLQASGGYRTPRVYRRQGDTAPLGSTGVRGIPHPSGLQASGGYRTPRVYRRQGDTAPLGSTGVRGIPHPSGLQASGGYRTPRVYMRQGGTT